MKMTQISCFYASQDKVPVFQDAHLMKVSCVGFCGADDSVDPRLLASISQVWVLWCLKLLVRVHETTHRTSHITHRALARYGINRLVLCGRTAMHTRLLGAGKHPIHRIYRTLHTCNIIAQRYPWVEWGVLFRDDKEGEPRFASRKWVDDLVAVNKTSTMQVT